MKVSARIGFVLAVGLAAGACSNSPSNPLAPSAATGGAVSAVPEGTPTLKVTTPGGPSPAVSAQVESLEGVVLSVSNAETRFAGAVPLQTRFQLLENTTLLAEPLVAAGGDGRSSWAVSNELKYDTTYRWRARAELGEAYGPWSAVWEFKTPPAPVTSTGGATFRTPDPPPGQRLPLPFRLDVVNRVAAQYPGALRNSCQEHGGTWEFVDRVVDELRKEDNRWGYNWKRGNVGDPSLDVIAYHHGPGPSEGSTAVYIIDIILQHCGNSPIAAWIDQTQATADSRSIGRWTGRGRFTN